MLQKLLEEMGDLYGQIQDDEKELENLRNCGNEVAKQLRVIADCLDTSNDYKIIDLPADRPNTFVSEHPDKHEARLSGVYIRQGPGHCFPIPQNLNELIKRIHNLERQIILNREKLDKKADERNQYKSRQS